MSPQPTKLTSTKSHLPFSTPFSHASEYTDFERRVLPRMRSAEMLRIERDMEDAGLDPAAYWPKGLLEWVWSHPEKRDDYGEVRRAARASLREVALHGMS